MIDNDIKTLIAEQSIPGLAVIIHQQDTILHEGYYGYANLEHRVPVSADTVFEIASVSKLFTAQAVLKLAQDQRLNLDHPIANYVKNLPNTWQTITVRHCLSHQSGIPNYTSIQRYWELQRMTKTHHQVLDLVRDLPLSFPAGTQHSYDNTGFYLLGMLIESVTERPYVDFVQDLIFRPLGMKATCANDYDRIIPHRAQGYTYRNETLNNKDFYDISNTFSAGIMLSTAADLLTWRTSLFDDTILHEDYRQLWWTIHPSAAYNERQNNYSVGLGWFMVESPLGVFLGHNGGITGFTSAFLYLPGLQTTAIFLCNRGEIDNPHHIVLDLIAKLTKSY